MEADWSVEIGPDLPLIDGLWKGLVDLRRSPLEDVEEARRYPALRDALLTLNGEGSRVFTTKCDVWTLPDKEIDPDEFAASGDTACAGFASYIDLIEREPARFASFEFHEQKAHAIAASLRELDVRQGRVDVVVRRALVRDLTGFGLTIYAAGCGADGANAIAAWQVTLSAAIAATISAARASSSIG